MIEKIKKNIIIIGAISLVVIIGLAWYLIGPKKIFAPTGETTGSATRTEAPANVEVPEMGEETEEGVAAPEGVAPVSAGGSSKYRIFSIKAEKGVYSPETIIVNKNDVIHIKFTAIDKTYDLTIPDFNMKQTAAKGETKPLEFQATTEGKFAFYCDLCGGLKSNAVGYIIISK
ncbi:MAG: cupredoxin domain-containing protein [bacterium]|nr:cupredoxin domain-containing protein [bacterium]